MDHSIKKPDGIDWVGLFHYIVYGEVGSYIYYGRFHLKASWDRLGWTIPFKVTISDRLDTYNFLDGFFNESFGNVFSCSLASSSAM